MPLTEWRYLKALPNLGLLFNVTAPEVGAVEVIHMYVRLQQGGREKLLCFFVIVRIYLFLTVNVGRL